MHSLPSSCLSSPPHSVLHMLYTNIRTHTRGSLSHTETPPHFSQRPHIGLHARPTCKRQYALIRIIPARLGDKPAMHSTPARPPARTRCRLRHGNPIAARCRKRPEPKSRQETVTRDKRATCADIAISFRNMTRPNADYANSGKK